MWNMTYWEAELLTFWDIIFNLRIYPLLDTIQKSFQKEWNYDRKKDFACNRPLFTLQYISWPFKEVVLYADSPELIA